MLSRTLRRAVNNLEYDRAPFDDPKTRQGKDLAEKRGRGRPRGSRTKRRQYSDQSVAQLLRKYQDPREVLLQIAQANVFDLAALLDCKPFEALQEKRLAAVAALPYVASRITPDVLVDRQLISLTISPGGNLTAPSNAQMVMLGNAVIEHRADTPSAQPEPQPIDIAGDTTE